MHATRHAPFKLASNRLVATLFAATLVAACGSKNNPAELVSKAKEHLAQGNANTAVIELKNALQNDPNLGEARYLLGKMMFDQGDVKGSEIELRKALALKYDNDLVIPALARSMLALGQQDQLLLEFEGQKLKSADAQADMQTLTGNAYLAAGKLDKASAAFIEAQTIKPDDVDGALGEARVLFVKKDFAAAEAKIASVLEKNPKSVPALLWMGDLQRTQGHLDQAVTRYKAAIAIEPGSFPAHFVLANAYLALNQMDAMRPEVQTLKKLAPKNAGVSYLEAMVAFQDKKYKEAKEAVQQSLALAPDNPQTLMLAGTIEQLLNEPAQSEQHLKQALAILPNNLFARAQLVRLYLQQRDPVKAESFLKPALNAAPDNAELLNLTGDIAIAKGEFGEASRIYGRAATLNPGNAQTLTQSAIAQVATGNSELGMAKLETASQMDQENARADVALVLVHLNKKEYDAAQKSWLTLQKKQPDNAMTYNLQAAILLGKADIPGARKALEHAVALQPTYYPAVSNLANLDLRDKQPDAAKQRYRALLDKDKNNLSALMALAQLEQSTGAPKATVLALLTQAKQGNPDATQPILALVGYRLALGETKQALLDINEALVKMPKNQQLLDVAGMTQMQAGEVEQAVSTFSQLAYDNPKQAIFQNRLGLAQLATGKVEAAMQSLTKSIELQPDAANLQASAVGALLQVGKADDAGRMLAVIQKVAPKSPVLTELSGNVQMGKGDYAAASATFKKLLASNAINSNLIKLHQALVRGGNTAEADTALNNWLKAHPEDYATLLYKANDLLEKKDYAKSAALYRTILTKQSDNLLALNNLAWASYQLKDGKALEYAEKAYGLGPENPAVLDTYGWILTEQGDAKRGAELLDKAVSKAPNQVDLKLHLAKALLKQGQKEAARTQLQAIVKAASNSEAGKESAQLLTSL